jgi:ATP-dependent Lhr-like helicase
MGKTVFSLLHPGVQQAIYQMRWEELRPIQVQTISSVMEGDGHVVVCAQTAGGKTEAAFLPVISKIAQHPQPSVQALYVGPLKALINDQFRRLEDLCRYLDITVHRWHGDVSATQKKLLREKPSGILLITPESLESNFINYGTALSRIYRDLDFVVIDELHAFLDNVRGVHLRSLLHRLSVAANRTPRIIGLSATLGDPELARTFIAPDAPQTVRVLDDPDGGGREIRFKIKAFLDCPWSLQKQEAKPRLKAEALLALTRSLESHANVLACDPGDVIGKVLGNGELGDAQDVFDTDDALEDMAEDIFHFCRGKTNLVFVNSKSTIEVLADRLHSLARQEHWPNDPFVVHHGALSKQLREDAEESLKSTRPTTAICSSTLEMGIDIGSAHAVAQVDPPWSVASMVQRLGRSGRRDGEPSRMRVYVREETPNVHSDLEDLIFPDLLRSIAMTRLMLAKWLESPDSNRMHLSTLTHQILSCLKQTGGMRAADLYRLLVQGGPFRSVTSSQFGELLRGLAKSELIEQIPQGELILAPLGERITGSFDFYAAFNSVEEFAIRYGADEIGKLPFDQIPNVNECLILAGRRWCVQEIIPESKLVIVVPNRGGVAPRFKSAGGEIHTRIMQEMKAVLFDEDMPSYLNDDGRLMLQSARHIACCLGLNKSDILYQTGQIQWFPWVGTRGLQTLWLHAKRAKIDVTLGKLSITYHVESAESFLDHLIQIAEWEIEGEELADLLPVKTTEKFDEFIPPNLLNTSNARSRLDLNEARTMVKYVIKMGLWLE